MMDQSKSIDFKWQGSRQYYAAIAANVIMLGQGAMIGWFSPALPQLLSEDTPLITGVLTSTEVSWVGSITNMGAMLGSFTFGCIVSFFGCKRAMILLAIPSTLFWVLIYFGNTYQQILLARFFTGWNGGGVQTTIVLYISEIANNNIRGRLGSINQLARSAGILIAYIVGAIVDYEYVPCIFVWIPILYALFFGFLPNTPQFHLRKDQTQKAEDSLKYYKKYEGKTETEVNAFNMEFKRLKSIATEQKTEKSLNFGDFTNREAIKGMTIGILLAYFSQLSGCLTIITYAVYILERTGTTLDPYKSSIAIAVMLITGSLCTTQLADKFGRKTCLISSLMGSAIGQISLALFLYLGEYGYDLSSISWLPVVCLAFTVFVASAGIVPLSHVVRVEHLPTKIRTIGLAICIFALNLTSFTCTKLFPLLIESVGLHGCMIIFAINCIVGSFFIHFILHETRGIHMDNLQSDQNKNKNKNEISKC